MTRSSAPDFTVRPRALLLDFGGVVFQTRKRAEAMTEFARHVSARLARAGHVIDAETLLPVLQGGKKALGDWKNAASRRLNPRELTHREIWRDFYASPLPEGAREVLVGEAGELQQWISLAVSEHTVRPGIPELLAAANELEKLVGHAGSTGSFAFRVPSRSVTITGTINQLGTRPYSYLYRYLDQVRKDGRRA